MTRAFEADAMRWEAGKLDLSELEARHPGEDVAALTGLWSQMAAMADAPIPEPGDEWFALRASLPDQAPAQAPRLAGARWRVRRTVVAAAAAALVGGTSIAYAAGVEPVRHEVDRIARHVGHLFGGADQGNTDQGDRGNVDSGNQGDGDDGGPGPQGGNDGPGSGRRGDTENQVDSGDIGTGDGDQAGPDQAGHQSGGQTGPNGGHHDGTNQGEGGVDEGNDQGGGPSGGDQQGADTPGQGQGDQANGDG